MKQKNFSNYFKSVRLWLFFGLIFSIIFSGYAFYYKKNYWGFSINPKETTNIWTIEAHISFTPTKEKTEISVLRPETNSSYRILDEDIVTPENYQIKKTKKRIILSTEKQVKKQDIYYRLLFYDHINNEPATDKPENINKTLLSEHDTDISKQILKLAESQTEGDIPQKIIRLINQNPPHPTIQSFIPKKMSVKDKSDLTIGLLNLKNIPTRIIRGFQLIENEKSFSPDIFLEIYQNNQWDIYNPETGVKGIPENFVILQRGQDSLIDVKGGENSVILFSVLKSVRNSFHLAEKRAKEVKDNSLFSFEKSIYNLPLEQQNNLKWLMIFPLAILVIVILRNIVGIRTMGTFTPMLIAMSLLKTGLDAGLLCFILIIGTGFFIRALLSRLNLLMVPRISAVVIFVILIIQSFTIYGHYSDSDIATSALFFPIIIMAWIIERASITWEEEGSVNALKELFWTLVASILTYLIIANDSIRYIMFVFNELNFVILFIVMLLGTYTGYRLTELFRFQPMVKKKGIKNV